jgi:PKHD-type hydroxylase
MFIPFERDTNSLAILTANNVFNSDECNKIIEYAKTKEKIKASIKDENNKTQLNEKIRKNKISWLSSDTDKQLDFVYEKLLNLIFDANRETYNFDIYGLTENIQFTEYSELNDHYDIHVDCGLDMPVRKLSMIVQLSNPLDYTGSELEIHGANELAIMSKDQGSVIIFPSYIPHKVTSLLSGTRYSLVTWVGGPKFK